MNPFGSAKWRASKEATKGVRWMPWHQAAMKDVVSCDMLRGAAKQALIRRFPNGGTPFLGRTNS